MSQEQFISQSPNKRGEKAVNTAGSNFLSILPFSILLLTVVIMCTKPITDSDIWFHLAYGKYILSNHTLILDHRIFSWTPASNASVYCQWIAQIIFYVCYEIGGRVLLFAIRYVTFLTYLLILYLYIRKYNLEHRPTAWLIALLSLAISTNATIIKPNMFSCLLMQLLVFIWYELKTTPREKYYWCYTIPLLTVIWNNTHGAWIFGFAFLCIVCVGEIMNMVISPEKALNPVIRKHLFIAVILSAVGTLINPYGWKRPFQIIGSMFQSDFRRHIKTNPEYFSVFQQIHSLGRIPDYLFFFLASLIIFGILFWPQIKSRKPDWTILLPVLLFVGLYLKFSRTMFLFAPIFAFSSFYLLSRYHVRDSSLPRRKKFLNISLSMVFIVLAIYINVLNIYRYGDWMGFGIGQDAPVDEAAFLNARFHGSRIGTDYENGSYLSWILWPRVKTSIDARYFPFQKWFDKYLKFVGGIQVDDFLKKYDCDVWCIGLKKPVIKYFVNSPEWELAYYGSWSAVFIKKGSQLIDAQGEQRVGGSIIKIKSIPRLLALIRFAQLVKDFDVARELIEKARGLRDKPELKSKLYARLAGEKYNLGNYEEASRLFLKALDENSNNIEGFYGLGMCGFSMNDLPAAEKYFRDAMNIDPLYSDVKEFLDRVQQKQVRIQESISTIRNSLRSDPDNPDLYYQLAMLYEMNGNPKQAETLYQKVLTLKPHSLGSLNRLGVLLVKDKKYIDAISCFRKISDLEPDLPDIKKIYYNIACLYAKLGKADEAVHWLKAAIDKGYNNWDLIKNDRDLNSIKGSPEYQKLITRSIN